MSHDYRDLRVALRRLQRQKLVNDSLNAITTEEDAELIGRLRDGIKAKAPTVKIGPVLAAEIVAALGWFLEERDPQ
jgi:hypothetical protein